MIKDEKSDTGKAQHAMLMAAFLSGRAVIVDGTGMCTRWSGGEDIGAVRVKHGCRFVTQRQTLWIGAHADDCARNYGPRLRLRNKSGLKKMRKPIKPRSDSYFAQGASWAQDRRQTLVASRRIAWTIAIVAVVVALCEAFALVILMPLKTVVPYTLMVDRQTGFVQALKPLDTQLVSADRALTQSFLVQYVIAREGFDRDTVQADYRKVGLWSAGRAQADYVASMQASNPDSPLVRLPASSTIDVQVKSVTPLGSNSALVRYDSRRLDNGGQPQPPQSWVAVVRYAYSGEPLSVADRFVNPLGFQVQRYRRSQEALPPPDPMPAPAMASSAGVGGVPVTQSPGIQP